MRESQSIVLAERYELLPLDELEAFPGNPRKQIDADALDGLVRSIREYGVLVPLRVRVVEVEGDIVRYEVVCGRRRANAARLAGLKDVPCMLSPMSEDQAMDVAAIDNLQRADIHALDEAQGYTEMLVCHKSIHAVALRVGKDVAYVAQRLRLLSLTAESQEALRERLISIDHALLLSRLGKDDQNAALKWCLDSQAGSKVGLDAVIANCILWVGDAKKNAQGFQSGLDADGEEPDVDQDDEPGAKYDRPSRWIQRWEPKSIQRLKEHIASLSGISLERAPWPMDENYLRSDGLSCLNCPQNTRANAPLFADLEIAGSICMDSACFNAKKEAYVDIQVVGEGYPEWKPGDPEPDPFPVLRVSWKGSTKQPGKKASVFLHGQWIEAAAGECSYGVPAVTIDYEVEHEYARAKMRKPGERVLACVDAGCQVHPKAYLVASATKSEIASGSIVQPVRLDREKLDRIVAEENLIRTKVFRAVYRQLHPAEILRLLAEEIGPYEGENVLLRDDLAKMRGLQGDVLLVLIDRYEHELETSTYVALNPAERLSRDRGRLWTLAEMAEVSADEIAAKHFHDAGSIAPEMECLYPKDVPWPKASAVPKIPTRAKREKTPKTSTATSSRESRSAQKTVKSARASTQKAVTAAKKKSSESARVTPAKPDASAKTKVRRVVASSVSKSTVKGKAKR